MSSCKETARLLRVSKWTVYRWIEEGRLRGTKIGEGSLRVFQESVNELVEKAKVEREDTRRAKGKAPETRPVTTPLSRG